MDPDPYIFSSLFLAVEPAAMMPESLSEVIWSMVVIVILLVCSGLVSASETAFFSLSPKDKNTLKNAKTKKSRRILNLLANPEKLLATILISNNFVNVAIIILSTYLSTYLFQNIDNELIHILLELVVVTFLILLFAEMMPKIVAGKFVMKVAMFMSGPLVLMSKLCTPLSLLLIRSTNVIRKRLVKKTRTNISVEELSHAIELASDELQDDKVVLEGFLNSTPLEVKEIMTSRVNVYAVEENTGFTKVIGQIVESGFSRIPVFSGNLDNIVGILYIKDILPYIDMPDKENFNWQKLVRPHFIVPETKKIHDLLFDFQNKKMHIAIVVDEYGGVCGLVTLEDILEEFVGEIRDESDVDEAFYKKIDGRTYEFDAKSSIIDFCRIVNVDYDLFKDIKGEADSLAGLVLEVHGEMPQKNENIQIGNFNFIVTAVDNRRIKKIKIILPKHKPANEDEQ